MTVDQSDRPLPSLVYENGKFMIVRERRSPDGTSIVDTTEVPLHDGNGAPVGQSMDAGAFRKALGAKQIIPIKLPERAGKPSAELTPSGEPLDRRGPWLRRGRDDVGAKRFPAAATHRNSDGTTPTHRRARFERAGPTSGGGEKRPSGPRTRRRRHLGRLDARRLASMEAAVRQARRTLGNAPNEQARAAAFAALRAAGVIMSGTDLQRLLERGALRRRGGRS